MSQSKNDSKQTTDGIRKLSDAGSKHTWYSNRSDAEIWDKYKSGCDDAYLFIYRTYVNELFNYGHQFTSERELIKDCMQELFTNLNQNRSTISSTDSIKPYLYKALRNHVLNALAKKKKISYEDRIDTKRFQIEASSEVKHIHQEIHTEKRRILEKALSQLTSKQREVILLYYYEGLSYREISQIMNLKQVKSARKLLYRALSYMKKISADLSI